MKVLFVTFIDHLALLCEMIKTFQNEVEQNLSENRNEIQYNQAKKIFIF